MFQFQMSISTASTKFINFRLKLILQLPTSRSKLKFLHHIQTQTLSQTSSFIYQFVILMLCQTSAANFNVKHKHQISSSLKLNPQLKTLKDMYKLHRSKKQTSKSPITSMDWQNE